MRLSSFMLFGCVLALPSFAGAQTLTPVERRIAAQVMPADKAARRLLERVVNINSGTMNFAGVRKVGDIFRAELDSLGFATRWVEGAPFKRAGHLVAEHKGKGPRVLLIGHLDTVFEPDNPFQKLEWLGDTAAHGPGVIDMKGGDVIIVYALKALKQAGVLDGMNIIVVMHGDEELAGEPQSRARQALIEAAKGTDIAMGFEDAEGNPRTATIARRGTTDWTLNVTGTSAHSGSIFRDEVGYGAVFEMARILDEFRTKLTGEEFLTFNPSVVVGGTQVQMDTAQFRGTAFGKTNVVAEHATVLGDVRTLSLEQLDAAKKRMQSIVADHLAHTSATLVFADGYPPMAPSAGNKALLAKYDQASRDLGYGPVTAGNAAAAGAADVSFVANMVSMAIDGLGLKGTDDHSERETADMRTLPMQIKRAALLLYRVTR
jgi:glutamate carboxypeptidase